ncbi:YibE/F family protein, partial [Nocardia tengchongensis]|uniref:YibE/F family protein n=1 Tax=Nocardia tengchongensis TaxID=2055889 RepID=UPI0036763D8B
MSDHHHHHHDHSGPIAIGATAAKVVVGLLAAIGVVVVAGLIWLWPSAQHIDIPLPMQNGGGGAVQTEAGTVVRQDIGPCGSSSNGRVFADEPQAPRANGYTCQRSIVTIDSGPSQGSKTLFEIAPGPGQPDLRAGDKIRIVRQVDPKASPDADPSLVTTYSFDDYARGLPLTIIGIVFAVVIIAVARWRGLRALLGLVVAFGVLVVFLLPALLDGKPAIPTALVAGAVILYAVLYLAHGVNLRTSSALLGTLSAMIVAAGLSWAALKMTHLTGFSEEQNTNVATYLQHVSITGLLLAGFIIGSLGVLNDVTITQASAAFELAELDEKATRRGIFAAAMRVGRDHIASTVYTLVLAYAGGALPLLMLFSVAGRSMRDVLTGDAVGIEIARSAVGGIALALSVPLTTAIAVLLARPPRTARAAGGRGGAPARGGGGGRAKATPPRGGGRRGAPAP